MEGERGVDAVDHPLVDHVDRVAAPLLSRLEHEPHAAREHLAPGGEDPGRSDEHRGVGIVPAGVHDPVELAREVETGVLGHRQRVHVAPQEDGRARTPTLEVGDDRRQSLAGGDGQAETVEGVEHLGLGSRKVEAQLGMAVQGATEVDEVGQQVRRQVHRVVDQRHVSPPCRRAGSP